MRRGGEVVFLRLFDLDPRLTHSQHIGNELGDARLGGAKLHFDELFAQDIVKIVKIPGDRASLSKVQGGLQVSHDEERMFDALGPQHDVVLLDGEGNLPQIFDHLLVEPHDELDGARALHSCFAIRLLDVHSLHLSIEHSD
jgi:hypothetical protein